MSKPIIRAPRVWVTMLSCTLPIAGALWTAGHADASPQSNYAAAMGPQICASLDRVPSVSNVTAIAADIISDTDFTPYETGQVIGAAVAVLCPWNQPVLQRFIDTYSAPAQVSSTFKTSKLKPGDSVEHHIARLERRLEDLRAAADDNIARINSNLESEAQGITDHIKQLKEQP